MLKQTMFIKEQNPLKQVQMVHLDRLKGTLKLVTLPVLKVVVACDEAHHEGNMKALRLLLFLFFILFLLYPKKLLELFETV